MTARLFTLDPLEGFRPKTFAGHKNAVLGAYFSADGDTVSLHPPSLVLPFLINDRSTLSAKMEQFSPGKQRQHPTATTQMWTNSWKHPLPNVLPITSLTK